MFEPMELTNDVVIKVIGVGGGDGNAAGRIVCKHIKGIEFSAMNTDAQALRKTVAGQTIQIGSGITKGLGTGANPEVGRNAADEDRDALRAVLEGADMAFIAAGTGSDTGTDAAPVVTEVAKDLGILTITVATKPLNSEGKKRMASAEQKITELSEHVNFPIIIPDDKLLKVLGRDTSLPGALGAANDVLKDAVQDIAELITRPGLMNANLADVRIVMSEMGYTMMGSGVANDKDRAEEVAEMVIPSPLLEDIDLSGARGVLVNITAGFDPRLGEFETVGNAICAFVSDNATAVIGALPDPDMNGELCVTVVATGIGMDKRPEITPVTNKQAWQPAMDRYQQHGVTPPTQEQKPVAKVVNDSVLQTAKEPDYLDISTFLHKQAD